MGIGMGMEKICGYGYGKNLWVWVWKKFCGYGYGKKFCCGMKFLSLKIFVGHEIFFGYPNDGSNTYLC